MNFTRLALAVFIFLVAGCGGCTPFYPFHWAPVSPAHAVVNEVTARNDYTGNGATTVFPYTFRILNAVDVEVIVGGVTKVINTEYSVSGVGASGGGSITMFTPPGGSVKVALLRRQPQSQLSTYQANEPFPALRLNNDFDKATMSSQMQAEQLNRSLHVAKYIYPFTTEINPTGLGGTCVKVNDAVTGFTLGTCGTGGGGGSGTVLGSGAADQIAYWLNSNTLAGTDEPIFKGPTPWADVRRYADNAATALATGAHRVYLPDGKTWVSSRTLPTNKTVFGDGLNSVIGDGTGFLSVGPQARLENVRIRDANTSVAQEGYVGMFLGYGLTPGTSYTTSGQDIGLDIWKAGATGTGTTVGVAVSHIGLGSGDDFYGQINPSGTQFFDAVFRGDNYAGFFNGSATATIYAGYQFASADSKARTLGFIDKRSVIDTSFPPILMVWEAVSTNPSLFYMEQKGASFSGNFVELAGAVGTGAFGGKFIKASTGGATIFTVGFDGAVSIGANAIALNANGAVFASIQTSIAGLNFVCIDNSTHQFFNKATICNGSGGGGSVASVTGTTNRILITGTATDPIVDISPNYVGQATITTLGTVATGTWNVPATTVTTRNIFVSNSAATSAASTGIVDYDTANNAARLIGRGPDASTNGQLRLITTRSDGSNLITAIAIDAAGDAVFSGNATVHNLVAFETGGVRGTVKLFDTGNVKYVGWQAPSTITNDYLNIPPVDKCLNGQVWVSNGASPQVWTCAANGAGAGVTSITGTSNRITVTGTTTPVIDIAAGYVGQTTITTLGIVTAGTWNVPATTVTTNNVVAKGAVATTVASTAIFDYDPVNNAARIIARGPTTLIQGQIRIITTRSDGSGLLTPITIDPNGNVGIGTTSPSNTLTVSDTVNGAQGYFTSNQNNAGFQVNNTQAGGRNWQFFASGGSAATPSSFRIVDVTAGGIDRIVINSSGNVGIGTTGPTSKLHVANGGIQVGNPAGGEIANGVNVQGGFFINGVAVTAGGIIGSGAQGQMTFWNSTSAIGGSNNNQWDNTLISQDMTKSSLNNHALFRQTITVSGSRSGVGTISIPSCSFGCAGPQEVTYATGFVINDTDTTTYPTDDGGHTGTGSATVVISKNFGSGFTGIGNGLIIQSTDTRVMSGAHVTEQDQFSLISFQVANSTVSGSCSVLGGADPSSCLVNSTNGYFQTARLSTKNAVEGVRIVVANFANDTNSQGLAIYAGDPINNGTEFTQGDAIRIAAVNGQNTVQAWTNAFVLYNGRMGTLGTPLLKIDGTGLLTATPTGNLTYQLVVSNPGGNGANILLTGNGADPNKFIRANAGNFEILNSTYSTVLWSMSNTGVITTSGSATLSTTKTVRASGGASDCTLIFTNGMLTGGSC